MSTGTVPHVPGRAPAAELSWPLPVKFDDEALRTWLYPASGRDSPWRVLFDRETVHEALPRGGAGVAPG